MPRQAAVTSFEIHFFGGDVVLQNLVNDSVQGETGASVASFEIHFWPKTGQQLGAGRDGSVSREFRDSFFGKTWLTTRCKLYSLSVNWVKVFNFRIIVL